MINNPKDNLTNEVKEKMPIENYCDKIKSEHIVVTPEPDMSKYVHMDTIQALNRIHRKTELPVYYWAE